MSDGEPSPWIRRVPNALSALRLGLALAFAFVPSAWRLPVVVTAGLTDWFDGFIARRYHAQSAFGGLLDAIADKAFVLAVLLTLALGREIEAWRIPLVLARDFAVAFVCASLAWQRRWDAFQRMPSRWPGKVTTGLLFVWFVVLLWPGTTALQTLSFWAVATSSLVAAVDYLLCYRRVRPRHAT